VIFKELGDTSVQVPAIGQGSLSVTRREDASNVLLGIESGMTFIDTADVYSGGLAEKIIGEAVQGIRKNVFISTKFHPKYNEPDKVIKAAEQSLRRLKTDYIDLYQNHWTSPPIPLEATFSAMQKLVDQGKVRFLGASNLFVADLVSLKGFHIVSNQVEYNVVNRFVEKVVLPYCGSNGMSLIAWSPLNRGSVSEGYLSLMSKKYGKTASQIILNWMTRDKSVIAIPGSSNPNHIQENASSVDFELEGEDVSLLDSIFVSEIQHVPVNEISVFCSGEGNQKVYKKLIDAKSNIFDSKPSPVELSEELLRVNDMKPVKLKPNGSGYDLIDGVVRYWAWVIAYDGDRPVPAYIVE
jgi:diketogulonate reductase-like aldo/keto reductase